MSILVLHYATIIKRLLPCCLQRSVWKPFKKSERERERISHFPSPKLHLNQPLAPPMAFYFWLIPLSLALCSGIHPLSALWRTASPWGGNPHTHLNSSQRSCQVSRQVSGPWNDTARLPYRGLCTPVGT